MKLHQLRQEQILLISITEAWEFFSTPSNLEAITPDDMKFEILSKIKGEKAYAGQIINYKVQPFSGIKLRWTTEISQCVEGKYFVDEQRFGPYAFWHHKHFFYPHKDGTRMVDIVDYGLPFGILGNLVHSLFVRKKLESIFAHRYKVLEQRFNA